MIDDLQERTATWVEDTFGVKCLMDKTERALRILEEAHEYAQSVGVAPSDCEKIRNHVYSRPVGDPCQELAGLGVSLLAAAESQDTLLSSCIDTELTRIEAVNPIVFRARKIHKREAGISQY